MDFTALFGIIHESYYTISTNLGFVWDAETENFLLKVL